MRVSRQNERIFGQKKGINGNEGEIKRNSGLEKKTQRRGKKVQIFNASWCCWKGRSEKTNDKIKS